MTAMLNEGILEKHIRKTQVIYSERRFHLIAALTRLLRGILTVASCSASMAPYYHSQLKPNQFIISFAILPSTETDTVVTKFTKLLLERQKY